jgi:hypothetical protein
MNYLRRHVDSQQALPLQLKKATLHLVTLNISKATTVSTIHNKLVPTDKTVVYQDTSRLRQP